MKLYLFELIKLDGFCLWTHKNEFTNLILLKFIYKFFTIKWTIYIINNLIYYKLNKKIYKSIFLYTYIYNHVILYIFKSNFILIHAFMNIILCLNLTQFFFSFLGIKFNPFITAGFERYTMNGLRSDNCS